MKDIRQKSEGDIIEAVHAARETIRAERFKDKFGRKASVIRGAKTTIARSLTELAARSRNPETK
jgi:ribosomal protein L29